MPYNPNPQGKGLVPVLQSLNQASLRIAVPPKQVEQIEMELFTSLFVLQSELRFSPVPGSSYWLYQYEDAYRLLMVAPDEWPSGYRGRFIGECVLQEDRTWTLELAEAVRQDEAFMAHLTSQQETFRHHLEQAADLESVLPVYEASLGFHGRIMAYTLGRSLAISMQLAGINALSFDEALGLLEVSRKKDNTTTSDK